MPRYVNADNLLLEFEQPAPIRAPAEASSSAELALDEFIAKQLARFDGLDYRPGTFTELIKALKVFPSQDSIRKFVDQHLDAKEKWPKVADISEFRKSIVRNQEWSPHPSRPPEHVCGKCGDKGYIENENGSIERCDCLNGKELPSLFLEKPARSCARRTSRDSGKLLAHMLGERPRGRGKPQRRK
jgi:hypothetical protein